MPRHEAGIAGFLDEERAAPAQNIGTDHAFDRIENRGMPDQAVQPGEQEMALVAHRALEHAMQLLHALQGARRSLSASSAGITLIGA